MKRERMWMIDRGKTRMIDQSLKSGKCGKILSKLRESKGEKSARGRVNGVLLVRGLESDKSCC